MAADEELHSDANSELTTSFLRQQKTRIRLRQDVIALLENAGVDDSQVSVTTACNEYLLYALRSRQTKLPDLRDMAGLEVALGNRLEELSRVTLALLEVATSIECSIEKHSLLGPFLSDLAREQK